MSIPHIHCQKTTLHDNSTAAVLRPKSCFRQDHRLRSAASIPVGVDDIRTHIHHRGYECTKAWDIDRGRHGERSDGKARLLNVAGEKPCIHITYDFSAVAYWRSLPGDKGGCWRLADQRRGRAASTVEAVSCIAVTDSIVRRRCETHQRCERRCSAHVEVELLIGVLAFSTG
jgi:hypothetical protein